MARVVYRLSFLLVFLILWESAPRLGWVHPQLFPSLGRIFSQLLTDLLNGDLVGAVILSLSVLFIALLISALLAVLISLLSKYLAGFEAIASLIQSLVHPIPGVALLPLFIMFFGISSAALYGVLIHAMLWPMVITLQSGLRKNDGRFGRLAQSFRRSTAWRVRHLDLAGCPPYLLSGLKIAWNRGFRAFISSEMIFGILGSARGLGYYLFEKRVFMDSAGLYGGLLVAALLGYLVDSVLFERLETSIQKRWGNV